MSDTDILNEGQVAEIEATAEALKDVSNACDITHAKPEFVNYILKCNPAAVSALCRALRVTWDNELRLAKEVVDLREQLAQVEPCVTCACGRPSWHREGDKPL